jgi:type IV pilus assembly protein PilV
MNARRQDATRPRSSGRSRGFSLVEVLVALVVVSVGLLGLAKMESLALASTSVASARSVAAIEAASLAAMMHANQDFWQNTGVYPSTVITSQVNPFAGAPACLTPGTSACSPQLMANYDLNLWATAVSQVLPAYSAWITCGTTPTLPSISCTIQIVWAENAVAMTSQQNNGTQNNLANLSLPTYTLYVQP